MQRVPNAPRRRARPAVRVGRMVVRNLGPVFNAAANNAPVRYEELPVPQNAINMFSLDPFQPGDKVIQYGRGKYIKVDDFRRFLNASARRRNERHNFRRDFVNAHGNQMFESPNRIPFRRGNVRFFQLV